DDESLRSNCKQYVVGRRCTVNWLVHSVFRRTSTRLGSSFAALRNLGFVDSATGSPKDQVPGKSLEEEHLRRLKTCFSRRVPCRSSSGCSLQRDVEYDAVRSPVFREISPFFGIFLDLSQSVGNNALVCGIKKYGDFFTCFALPRD